MLQEGILRDITVNAVGGNIRAHRAVLAARSPVFLSMFSHNLREKELSAVDISDMSIAACRAFYGAAASEEELLAHRVEFVVAGDKYGVTNLKEACEESMRADICSESVLERLQVAHTYGLPALKKTCVRLLVDFGQMYQIPEDFEEFMKTGDQELVDEIKQIAASRGRKFPVTQKSAVRKPNSDSTVLLRRSTRLKKLKLQNE
jgi:speckle-type POZ protein